jgi:hypothetical protein
MFGPPITFTAMPMVVTALPVAFAFDDEFIGRRLQPVHRRLGQQRVGHLGQDLRWLAVRGDDRGGFAVAFDDQLVEVNSRTNRRR